ncbi:ATP-binding protein [Nitrospirillum sp. BR 11164]|uniref:ATP-binding protein n=1 Tax=Nitrospirillum sp. BR 11164 TaxID=3104324 RepID=UPI002AFF577E|nr:ATP-binding protein [Nitrospirillum sp. BR 11164]MEA1653028.1 ATP-binding protein [Nitrospirillum sp. BR 11164]
MSSGATREHGSLAPLVTGMDERRTLRSQLWGRISEEYIHTRRDDALLAELQGLVDTTLVSIEGGHPEGRMLAVVGQPGAGKTWSIERALARLPGLADSGTLLAVTAPSPSTLKQLGRATLRGLGYPLAKEMPEHILWEKVRQHLALTGTRFIWIDEMHHAMGRGGDSELTRLCDVLKSVMQQRDWPVSLILSGLPTVSAFVGRDRQVERRSRTLRFDPLSFPKHAEMLRTLLTDIIRVHAGVGMDGLQTDEFLHRLCRAGEGEFGTIIALVRQAIMAAFDRAGPGSSVGIEDFAREFMRQRGCSPEQNIFLAAEWDLIDPRDNRQSPIAEIQASESIRRRKRGAR